MNTRDIDTTIGLARAAWSRGDAANADRLCREGLALDPDHAEGLLLIAEIRLAATPDEPLAHLLMAHALRRADRAGEAIPYAEAAVAAEPGDGERRNMLGLVLRESGRLDDAIEQFRLAVAAVSGLAEFGLNLGAGLIETDRGDEARDAFSAVLRDHPELAEAWLGLGNARRLLGDAPAAADAYREATKRAPQDARAFNNLGVAAQQCGAFGEARASFDRAIALRPDLAEAQKNRAMLRLLQGDFAAGFEAFQWRWKEAGRVNRPRPFTQSAWDGAPLLGKTILVWGEQGVADEIMFASLLPEIIAAADHCIVECETRLAPLFARSFPTAEIVARTDPPHPRLSEVKIDLQCAAGDACRWLRADRASFAAPPPYLHAALDRTAALRGQYDKLGGGPKIGIAWHSRTPQWGEIKSTALDQWGAILTCPDVVWINLQYGDRVGELDAARRAFGVTIHHDPNINQFADLDAFAAQTAGLDIVVTTSNTTAHMAGALGVPTLLLLASVPDWRWQAAGDTALWYPDTTLFRQNKRGDWSAPIDAAAAELAARAAGLSRR